MNDRRRSRRKRPEQWLVIVLVVLLVAPVAGAEQWGGLNPGQSVKADVQSRFGEPTKETKQKLEGYDTIEWLYEPPKAPAGFTRMLVEFGLLTPQGYQPDVVRALMLTPRAGIFSRQEILIGWGRPDSVGEENNQLIFLYKSGLIVVLDKNDERAEQLVFTVPQPDQPAQ
jgi:hypothetical protein